MAAIGLVGFLGIRPEQHWILWLTGLLVALSVDGTIRGHPGWERHAFVSALAYVLLPGIAVVGAGYFLAETLDGYARTLAGLAVAIGIGVVAYGEYTTADFEARMYGHMRIVLAVTTYLVAFAVFTVAFEVDRLWLSATIVGLASGALAIELVRESRLLDSRALLLGFAVGASIAELRLVLYFFPLDGLLAGALLVIGFYLATGLVHHLAERDLHFLTFVEYMMVTGVAVTAVVVTRVTVGT